MKFVGDGVLDVPDAPKMHNHIRPAVCRVVGVANPYKSG